jgi:hypothetical protein
LKSLDQAALAPAVVAIRKKETGISMYKIQRKKFWSRLKCRKRNPRGM